VTIDSQPRSLPSRKVAKSLNFHRFSAGAGALVPSSRLRNINHRDSSRISPLGVKGRKHKLLRVRRPGGVISIPAIWSDPSEVGSVAVDDKHCIQVIRAFAIFAVRLECKPLAIRRPGGSSSLVGRRFQPPKFFLGRNEESLKQDVIFISEFSVFSLLPLIFRRIS
jgi:hypothetical protein